MLLARTRKRIKFSLRGYFAAVASRLRPDGRCFAQINTTVSDSTWLQFPFLCRTAAEYEPRHAYAL